MKKAAATFLLLLAITTISFAQKIDDAKSQPAPSPEKHGHPPGFESDGCTAFPDGNYRDCCEEHDLDYYKGGSFKERRASDKRLYSCVKSKPGWKNKYRAPMIYLGVRVFGTAWLPTRFRWGFGKKKMKRLAEAAKSNTKKEEPAKETKSDEKGIKDNF